MWMAWKKRPEAKMLTREIYIQERTLYLILSYLEPVDRF